MPQLDVKYSSNLVFDAPKMLREVERTIAEVDSAAGQCKGRAYPTSSYHHTHIMVSVAMLPKPHRDDAFSEKMLTALETTIKSFLTQDCAFSLQLDYTPKTYVTNQHKATLTA